MQGAFVVSTLFSGLFFMIPTSRVCSKQDQRLSTETKPCSQVILLIERQTLWKYVCLYSGLGKGNHQQYLCLFLFTLHIKRQRDQNCSVVAKYFTAVPLFFSDCGFVSPFKSKTLAYCLCHTSGTLKGGVIGCTGWGICWHRHGC